MADEVLSRTLHSRDPEKIWAEEDDVRRGCKSCAVIQFSERRGRFCGLERPEYPNGGEGVCRWYKRKKPRQRS